MQPLRLASLILRRASPGVIVVAFLAASVTPAAAQAPETTLAIDMGWEGNGLASLGETENCLEADPGDEFQIDLVIRDVEELLAWDVTLAYDPEVVEIVELETEMFLAANAGSSVFDVSDVLPDTDGQIGIAAADTSDPPTPDSGSGPLARIKMRALTEGETTIEFVRLDTTDDGLLEIGPFLRSVSGEIIGDTDGDTYFDGDVEGASIAVGTTCPPGSRVATAPEAVPNNNSEDDDGSSDLWIYLAGGGGAVALIGLIAGAFVWRRNSA